ncbi:hypothetical protein GCM10009759_75840 [Kitasatospora saccharophila]|uniref:pPIWI-RE three-gene island domain-containing protein n=1 Tax=Kitasatospora saccharophila TaxID=407973 RepID=A0ABP5JXK9_9ACTN
MTPDPDLDLLTAVARGIVDLSERIRPSAFRLPYPPGLQLALDRLVLKALRAGTPVPGGVAGLLAWCGTPLTDLRWPLALPPGLLSEDAALIDPEVAEPTRTCAELASIGPHGELERSAEALMANLADTCGTPERFDACRDFLISRPVMLRPDPVELLRPTNAATWKLVKDLYAPVPERMVVDRSVSCCLRCGLLAKALPGAGTWCEGRCPVPEPERSEQPARAVALPLGLRLFTALPGRTEAELRRRLGPTPGGRRARTARRLLVLDREQPALAARRAAELAGNDRPSDVVLPDHLADRPGYRQRFRAALPLGADIVLHSVTDYTASANGRPRRTSA